MNSGRSAPPEGGAEIDHRLDTPESATGTQKSPGTVETHVNP